MRFPISVLQLAVVCAVAAALAGCRTASSAGITVESYQKNQIEVGSKILGDRVKISAISVQRRGELLAANITAINVDQEEFACEYRYTWFDKDGMELPSAMSVWKPANFHGRAQVSLQAIAPSRAAEDFKVVLRFRKSSTRF